MEETALGRSSTELSEVPALDTRTSGLHTVTRQVSVLPAPVCGVLQPQQMYKRWTRVGVWMDKCRFG